MTVVDVPSSLSVVVDGVKRLWSQERSFERAHEHVVAQFFEALGYKTGEDLLFRVANMDIVLTDSGGSVLAVIEVKADRGLTATDRTVINQAFGYALESGARFVVISNGNYYAVFDREKSLFRKEALLTEFRLLALDGPALTAIETLRKGVLQ
jgi:predicted type IV restriction endonuclease